MNTIYSTHKWSHTRVSCPHCGARRGFAAVKGNPGFGKCFACGEFITPQKNANLSTYSFEQNRKQLTEEQQQVYIDDHEAMKTIKPLLLAKGSLEQAIEEVRQRSPFHGWLIDRTGIPHIFHEWGVGLDASGNTLFWHENEHGGYVNCKVVRYGADAHRDKSNPPHFLYSRKQGFGQCLYGIFQLHQAYYPNRQYRKRSTPVVLVESEKTAILCSVYKPEFVWLATGGANGLTKEKAGILQDRRNVVIWYDADNGGRQGAQKAVALLLSMNIRAQVYDPYPNLNDGTDTADLLEIMSIRRAG